MGNKRKEYRLPEETIRTINQIKAEQRLATGSETIRFLVDHYHRERIRKSEEDDFVARVAGRVEESLSERLDQLRLTARYIDKNSRLTLEAINTLLYETNANVLMEASGVTRHNVIVKAEEKYQERLEHNKQMKNNRNATARR